MITFIFIQKQTDMKQFALPYFREIDLDNVEEYYYIEIEYKDNELNLDLNFDESLIEPVVATQIKYILDNIEAYDIQNRLYIDADYAKAKEGSFVNDFVNYHLEDIGEEICEDIAIDLTATDRDEQFIKKLKLVRIGMYPDGKRDNGGFAVFDYSINPEITDQLLVINVDALGNLQHVSWES